jgi:hypothetical protein
VSGDTRTALATPTPPGIRFRRLGTLRSGAFPTRWSCSSW